MIEALTLPAILLAFAIWGALEAEAVVGPKIGRGTFVHLCLFIWCGARVPFRQPRCH
jgi:hypothetical protein